jgi:type IV pilus assembly protein PilP
VRPANRRLAALLATLSALVVFTGCGDEATAPTAPPAALPRPKLAAQEAQGAASSVEYVYNPLNKRDPFRNLLVDGPRQSEPGLGDTVCDDPLCKFDLDELTVVAVVSGDANPLAMVEDKGGVGHIVRRNSKVGKQGGKVTQVLRDCVVVTSFVTGPDGKAQPNKQNLCVRPDVRSAPVLDLLDGKLRQ